MTKPTVYLLIAGSRTFDDEPLMARELYETLGALDTLGYENIKIISGMAPGADTSAVKLAKLAGIELIAMPADWDTHGKAAGPIRNREMAKLATHALLFWDGQSRGTKSMIEELEAAGKPYQLVVY